MRCEAGLICHIAHGISHNGRFAGRVLDLAKKLRASAKMLWFLPLCFTRYVMVTPKDNPAGIKHIKDLARSDVRVVPAPEAFPPGGAAALTILEWRFRC